MQPEEMRRVRQEIAAPLLAGLFEKIQELRRQMTPPEPLRKAINYTLNQRKTLCRCLEDGRLRSDNNLAENAMRPVAIEKTGSSSAANGAAALLMSLVRSCKDCGINLWEYFDDMLRRSMSQPVNRLRELLPGQRKPFPNDERGLLLAAQA